MSTPHPLDPLTGAEISATSNLIREKYPRKDWIFNSIILLEPPKESVLADLAGKSSRPLDRKSFVILIERKIGYVHEVTVNLTKGNIEKFYSVPSGHQPTITPEECFAAEKIAKSDVGVIQRCKDLGITNMELVVGDPWSIGYNGHDSELEGKRLIQLFMYYREFEGDNHYAHPLDFVPIVDIIAEKVIRTEDLPVNSSDAEAKVKNVKVPTACHNYESGYLRKDFHRKDVKPIEIVSPEGPSFTVNGNEIQWQKFKMRISFNYREGLVLHNITYQDGVKERPLFYRMALAEMVVPYGDPRPPFHRKCAFDVGDYGLGFCANSLELGCDCLGTIKYLDAILNNHNGEPSVTKNAICLHEEDAGILFKHTEYRTGKVTVTRLRRLILSFIATVVNYEYAMYWTFGQDGTIGFDVKATGELSTNLINSHMGSAHGSLVAENINAQFHQHLFAVRIDPMIDGLRNDVSTLDVLPLAGEFGSAENPYGQGFKLVENLLKTTTEAKTQVSAETSRSWKISNSTSLNSITKKPVGFKLIPTNSATLLAKPNSFVQRRAGFAANSVWVTPYNEEERFPAGFYVNQSKGGEGLPEWTKDEKSIVDQDIVLWHVFGVTHIPRVEDFPIMTVEPCGFTLKPCNFFTANPALDVPPSIIGCHSSEV